MKVTLFGASGMVGAGVLLECLEDPRVTAVLSVGRTPLAVKHVKLSEQLTKDLYDVESLRGVLAGYDACFFCLGTSSAGMNEADYRHITYDLTLGIAHALAELNPAMTFTYVSGEGTDSTEHGRVMWARVKGKTENDILALPFKGYAFRPGMIRPLKGVKSKTPWVGVVYAVLDPLFPVLKTIAGSHLTTSVNLGRAMIRVAVEGYANRHLENDDINALGEPPRV
jgi:uncharacterized protein YbjT (DUF2867 family)